MTKLDSNTTFYEQNEQIDVPSSFKLMSSEGNTYLYGSGRFGREVSWTYNQNLGRWGWVVRKVEFSEGCCT